MVLVLVSVTTFYAFASFGSGGMIGNSSGEFGSGGMIGNSSGEFGSGGMIGNLSGSIIPSTGMINSEQNEKKS
jgi:hypothetical protein